MNAIRSHIFMMPSASWKPGPCWVCGEPALLKFRDTTTGKLVGTCCVGAALSADRFLLAVRDCGIRHPSQEESNQIMSGVGDTISHLRNLEKLRAQRDEAAAAGDAMEADRIEAELDAIDRESRRPRY